MHTLLLLTYYFPPSGGAGTQRPASFTRQLPRHGWHPVVVAPADGHEGPAPSQPRDDTLVDDLADAEVHFVDQDASTVGLLRSPHRRVGHQFLEPARAAATRITAEQDVDVIMATLSPFALADVALDVGQRRSLPVVLDLRDPWALDGWVEYRSWLDWVVEAGRMRRALSRCDAVIANTPEARSVLVERGGSDPERTFVITNGWDARDFPPEEDAGTRAASDDRLLLVHVGTFPPLPEKSRLQRLLHYRPEPIDPRGRTAFPLLDALRLLEHDDDPVAVPRFVHVGTTDEPTAAAMARLRAATSTGYVEHDEAVAWMRRADALFLPLHAAPDGRRSRIVPGKTYEYLGAGRPILAALPPGDARDFAMSVPGSRAAVPDDPASIAAALRAMAADHAAGRLPRGRSPVAGRFERDTLTGTLADVLDVVRTS